VDKASEIRLETLIESFRLPVRLWVVSGAVTELDTG